MPIRHDAYFVADESSFHTAMVEKATSADLVVFNTYSHAFVRRLLKIRSKTRRPWSFWGERPGFHGLGWLGRAYRYWRLAPLRRTRAPIWGIGEFAIQGYQIEFGTGRVYENIPYYSNLERFRPPVPRVRAGADGHTTILYSGTLCHRKGVDLLAKAFTRIARHSNLQLIVLGDGPYRSYLQRVLSPFQERVKFLGFQNWQALPEIYWKADVLCVPSRYDGWGLVVPEGLAAGLPVIATDKMGAAIDLIKDGVNGWRLPAGDLNALTALLREVQLLSPDRLTQLSEAATRSGADHSLKSGAERFAKACQMAIAAWATA